MQVQLRYGVLERPRRGDEHPSTPSSQSPNRGSASPPLPSHVWCIQSGEHTPALRPGKLVPSPLTTVNQLATPATKTAPSPPATQIVGETRREDLALMMGISCVRSPWGFGRMGPENPSEGPNWLKLEGLVGKPPHSVRFYAPLLTSFSTPPDTLAGFGPAPSRFPARGPLRGARSASPPVGPSPAHPPRRPRTRPAVASRPRGRLPVPPRPPRSSGGAGPESERGSPPGYICLPRFGGAVATSSPPSRQSFLGPATRNRPRQPPWRTCRRR